MLSKKYNPVIARSEENLEGEIKKVKIIHHSSNRGVGASTLTGFKAALAEDNHFFIKDKGSDLSKIEITDNNNGIYLDPDTISIINQKIYNNENHWNRSRFKWRDCNIRE